MKCRSDFFLCGQIEEEFYSDRLSRRDGIGEMAIDRSNVYAALGGNLFHALPGAESALGLTRGCAQSRAGGRRSHRAERVVGENLARIVAKMVCNHFEKNPSKLA